MTEPELTDPSIMQIPLDLDRPMAPHYPVRSPEIQVPATGFKSINTNYIAPTDIKSIKTRW
jgi:hypothetical protein